MMKNDIAQEMLENLSPDKVKISLKNAQLSLALEFLNKSAKLLDEINQAGSAEKIVKIMEKLAQG